MLKFLFTIFLALVTLSVSAQNKYQSLFWEIKAPGKSSSYIYGTMHVSDKIAYHLTDAFYEALLEVDYVALESDPKEWLEAFDDGRMSKEYMVPTGMFDYEGFYRWFGPEPMKEDILEYYLSQGNELLNGILYRNTMYEEDFQEDTYLDMFIYQAANKYNKQFIGLEDYDESSNLALTASLHYEYKENYAPWLTKLLKEKSFSELSEDAYRDQDLDMLDSLTKEINGLKYNKYMIDDRNLNMANQMDALMKTGSVFAGVGAAHLPGTNGVIELLRERGYEVVPLQGQLTKKGEKLSKEIDDKRTLPDFEWRTAPDNMFRVKWLNKLYEFADGIIVSPDLTNGAYALISRIGRYHYLFPDNRADLDIIDELIFEFVPGEIVKKSEKIVSGYKCIDLLNKTRNGDHQRYQFIETPLEILIFKLDGPKDYVVQFGEAFFNSIEIKKVEPEMVTIATNFNGCSVTLPSFYKIENHTGFASFMMPPFVQGYDPVDSAFYFLSNQSLTDLSYIEDDQFEHRMIHKRFYELIEIEDYKIEGHRSKAAFNHPDTLAIKDSIFIQTFLLGNQYYCLAYKGKQQAKADQYFRSFQSNEFLFIDSMNFITDTILQYRVKTYNDPPYYDIRYLLDEDEMEKRQYRALNETVYYFSPANEQIRVSYTKYPIYEYYENIDSLWRDLTKVKFKFSEYRNNGRSIHDLSPSMIQSIIRSLKLIKKEESLVNEKFPALDVYMGKPSSSKMIRHKYILNHGVLFQVSAMLDSTQLNSQFIQTFFDSFTPLDTTIGYSPFEDKSALFFKDINSTDTSRREAALKSIKKIEFEEGSFEGIAALIDSFPFSDEELKYKADLAETVGTFKSVNANKHLIGLFKESEYNSIMQMAIIHSLAVQQQLSSAGLILDLLEYDIPLPEKGVGGFNSAYKPFYDSLELAMPLYPDLLKYSNIEEYKELVYGLLARLRSEKNYPKYKYEHIKDQLITECRIELKRIKAKELRYNANDYYKSPSSNNALNYYITLLAPFYDDAQVKNLFGKIKTVDNVYTLVHLALTMKDQLDPTDIELFGHMLKREADVNELAKVLVKKEEYKLIDILSISQDDIAMAELMDAGRGRLKSHELLFRDSLMYDSDTFVVYIFKFKTEPRNNYGNGEKWKFGAIAYHLQWNEHYDFAVQPYFKNLTNGYDNTVLIPGDQEEEMEFYNKTKESIEYIGRKRVRVEPDDYY